MIKWTTGGLRTAAVSALLVGATYGPASAQEGPVLLPEGFAHPNGIAHLPDGALLVGAVATGNLLRVDRDGIVTTWREETADLFAGTAIRYDPATDLLWITSPDFLARNEIGGRERRPNRLAAVDVISREVVWSVEMPSEGFANDLALDGRGGVYVTETLLDRVYHLSGPGAEFVTVAEGSPLEPGILGPAGIVMLPNGDLVTGLYSDGAMFRIVMNTIDAPGRIERLDLAREIENPDGMALAPDGRLVLIEGGVESGRGALIAIDLNASPPHPVETLLDGLDMPLNLSLDGGRGVLTVGALRSFMLQDPDIPVPDRFRVVPFDLGDWPRAAASPVTWKERP